MTLVSLDATDSPQSWSDVQLRHRACTVFVNCAVAEPHVLPALASAFAAYLVAGRDASPEGRRAADGATASARLSERVAQLGAILRRAEQSLDPAPGATPLLDPLGRLEAEAAEMLADVRDVLRDLPSDQPATQRLRLALIGAWGRYDDALAELRMRWRRGNGGIADLAVMAKLHDALMRNLESARARSGGELAYANGGRVQR